MLYYIAMPVVPRPRHYLSPFTLMLLRPLFRYSSFRGAYVLRVIGESHGPVLRENQRRSQSEFEGPDRRGALVGADRRQAIV